jgi:hypothetical protein
MSLQEIKPNLIEPVELLILTVKITLIIIK